MKVSLHPHPVGTHRAEYSVLWHDWALPIRIVFAQSWLPKDDSSMEMDTWAHRRYIVIHVLVARLEFVLFGPLWPDAIPEEDGA